MRYANKRYTRIGYITYTLVDKYELSQSGAWKFVKTVKLRGKK